MDDQQQYRLEHSSSAGSAVLDPTDEPGYADRADTSSAAWSSPAHARNATKSARGGGWMTRNQDDDALLGDEMQEVGWEGGWDESDALSQWASSERTSASATERSPYESRAAGGQPGGGRTSASPARHAAAQRRRVRREMPSREDAAPSRSSQDRPQSRIPKDRATRSRATHEQPREKAQTRERQPLLIAIFCLLIVLIGLSGWLLFKVISLEGTAQEAWDQSASNTSNLAALDAAVSDLHDRVYGSSQGDASQDGTANAAGSTAVASPHTASGVYDSGDAELNKLVKDFCDSHTDVFDSYLGVAWAEYIENDENQDPQGSDWWRQYAKDQFTANGGNCYNFAAAIQEILRYYGYEDAKAFPAIVKFRSGDWGPHGIITVTENGDRKIIDPSRGTEGWMCAADSILYEVDDTKG